VPRDTIALLQTREEINDLLELDSKHIDLIIPRGSNQLVKTIQQSSKSIPVMGHAEGICHVYVHVDADEQVAMRVARDAKCDYPSACNAMETLLVHKDLVATGFLQKVIDMFQMEKVKVNLGPRARLATGLTNLDEVKNFSHEYSELEMSLEIVDDERAAIEHINKYGSGHTESIITKNS
jgi:delta-1-pyrroline-5-carboxylate synthetase